MSLSQFVELLPTQNISVTTTTGSNRTLPARANSYMLYVSCTSSTGTGQACEVVLRASFDGNLFVNVATITLGVIASATGNYIAIDRTNFPDLPPIVQVRLTTSGTSPVFNNVRVALHYNIEM